MRGRNDFVTRRFCEYIQLFFYRIVKYSLNFLFVEKKSMRDKRKEVFERISGRNLLRLGEIVLRFGKRDSLIHGKQMNKRVPRAHISTPPSISIGKTCVTLPIPWVLPVRNRSLDPVLTNSGCWRKRKSTEAVSLVTMCLAAMIPSNTAVCWMLPMCTVVWNPLCMLVEWKSTTIVAYVNNATKIRSIQHHPSISDRRNTWKKRVACGFRCGSARIMPFRMLGNSMLRAREALWPARTTRHEDLWRWIDWTWTGWNDPSSNGPSNRFMFSVRTPWVNRPPSTVPTCGKQNVS